MEITTKQPVQNGLLQTIHATQCAATPHNRCASDSFAQRCITTQHKPSVYPGGTAPADPVTPRGNGPLNAPTTERKTMTTLGTLTSRQTALLTAIIDFMVDNGYCPCYRELQELLGLKSKNGVSDHIKVLEQKGYLRVIKGCARGLVVLYTPTGEPFRHVWQDITNLEAEVSHA